MNPMNIGEQAVCKSEGTTLAESSSIRPTWIKTNSIHPPGYRYRWAETEAALKTLAEKPGDPVRWDIAGICESLERRPDPADDVVRDPNAAAG